MLFIYRREILLALIYAISCSLLFHFPQLASIASLTLIPLFFSLCLCHSRKEAFFIGYLAGIVQIAITYYWILHVTIVGWIALCIYLGFYTALFGLLTFQHIKILFYSNPKRPFAFVKIFHIASIWVLIEFLRSYIPVMKFPWALFGYTQWKNLTFIQSADIFGGFGVSWILVLTSVALFGLLGLFKSFFDKAISLKRFLSISSILILIAATVFGANIFYGNYQLEKYTDLLENSKKTHRVAVIQGNIPQEEKWDERIRGMIYQKYDGLTRQVIINEPDLIVWPETSFPGYWEVEPEMVNRILRLARDLRTKILVGSPTFREGDHGIERMNSAILLSSFGGELDRHHKLRLVPFGEYIPFFKFIRQFFEEIGKFSPGEKYTIFDADERAPFAVLICFEDIFPDLCRKFVNLGSRYLINITNDAWFKKSTGPYQHAQSSVFRAVENRVPVVRAANTGLSCFINPKGQIEESVQDEGEEIMISGFKTHQIKFTPRVTFYQVWGDSCMILVLILWIFTGPVYLRSLQNSENEPEY